MTTTAGYLSTVKITGTSTAFTDEATTEMGDAGDYAARYQITDAAMRVLDPAAAVTVYDNAVEVDADDYTVDYLAGIIGFADEPTGPVTVDGSYLPLLTVGLCRSASMNMSRAELDSSELGEAYTKFELGKKTADGSLERLELFDVDLDPGAGSFTWQTLQDNGTPKLLEVDIGAELFRAWVLLPSLSGDIPQDGLVTGSIAWKSIERKATGRSEIVSFTSSAT